MEQAGPPPKVSRWRWLLRHRQAPGAVIPPDARVDPDRFPEEDFPLYCPACDYLLRGLPGDRCPECGQPFDRGRLLVEQYVIQQGRRNSPRTRKYVKWALVLGVVLGVLGPLPMFFAGRWLPAHITQWPVSVVVPIAMGSMVIGFILVLSSAALDGLQHQSIKSKCRQVFDAIDQTNDSYRRAQRWGRGLSLVVLVPCAAFVCYGLYEDGCYALGHYSQHSEGLLPAIGIGLGAGALIVGIHALVTRLYRRYGRDDR